MTYQPYSDRRSFLVYFEGTVKELVKCIEYVFQLPQLAPFQEEIPKIDNLLTFFPILGLKIAATDGVIVGEEIDFLHATIGLNPFTFPIESLKDKAQIAILMANLHLQGGKLNDSIEILMDAFHMFLEIYDTQNGTVREKESRDLIFAFSKELALADGAISKPESVALVTLREYLYKKKGSPLLQPNQSNEAQLNSNKVQKSRVVMNSSFTPPMAPSETDPKLTGSLADLHELIGLQNIKRDVSEIANFARIQKLRESRGLPPLPIARHLVFFGNPGTGKTTVARLLAQIYGEMRILSKGHFVEADRSALVAGYVGQTALKVAEVVESALGGVLFIDEAYSLNSGRDSDYGAEAINVLLKLMEDHRDNLVVIVAGYTDKMNEFLSSNPGLRSRFTTMLRFEDYKPHELLLIFERLCAKNHYRLDASAKTKLNQVFTKLYQSRDSTFGNARIARTLFEMSTVRQANRVLSSRHQRISDDNLVAMTVQDIPEMEDMARLSQMRV